MLGRSGVVVLDKGCRDASRILKDLGVEALEEKAPIVAKDAGLNQKNIGNGSRRDVHKYLAYLGKLIYWVKSARCRLILQSKMDLCTTASCRRCHRHKNDPSRHRSTST
jgi:hypothetical protein